MLKVKRVREFVVEIKTAIPQIKYTQVIVTNEEFTNFLKERKTSENILLFAVIPEHSVSGKDRKSQFENYLQLFFIEKNPEKNLKHDAKLDLYNRVQEVVHSFIQLLLEAKEGESTVFGSCDMLDDLNEESIDIKVFWDGLESRGYEVVFDLKTKI